MSALAVHQNDALFMTVSMKGETKEVIDIAKLAQEMTIPLIVISGREDSTLAKLADCLLHSVSGEDYKMRTAATMSLMAQLYVVDVLFYMYVSKHFAQSYQKLQQTKAVIKKLEQ